MLMYKVYKSVNEQTNKEFYSGYLFLCFSTFFDKIGLYRFANFYKTKAKNKIEYGLKILNYNIQSIK